MLREVQQIERLARRDLENSEMHPGTSHELLGACDQLRRLILESSTIPTPKVKAKVSSVGTRIHIRGN